MRGVALELVVSGLLDAIATVNGFFLVIMWC